MNGSGYLLFFLLLFLSQPLLAQDQYTISGYVRDAANGETLIGANVFNKDNPGEGTNTNIDLQEDIRLSIELKEGIDIQEVLVTAEAKDKNVSSTEMGTIDLPVENIKTLPALLGEVDILKALQLLPGVLSSTEGNAGFYVRGGGPDQNLVLLDEAVVYNSGHMLGFFSVFNADAIKNTTLIKGGRCPDERRE